MKKPRLSLNRLISYLKSPDQSNVWNKNFVALRFIPTDLEWMEECSARLPESIQAQISRAYRRWLILVIEHKVSFDLQDLKDWLDDDERYGELPRIKDDLTNETTTLVIKATVQDFLRNAVRIEELRHDDSTGFDLRKNHCSSGGIFDGKTYSGSLAEKLRAFSQVNSKNAAEETAAHTGYPTLRFLCELTGNPKKMRNLSAKEIGYFFIRAVELFHGLDSLHIGLFGIREATSVGFVTPGELHFRMGPPFHRDLITLPLAPECNLLFLAALEQTKSPERVLNLITKHKNTYADTLLDLRYHHTRLLAPGFEGSYYRCNLLFDAVAALDCNVPVCIRSLLTGKNRAGSRGENDYLGISQRNLEKYLLVIQNALRSRVGISPVWSNHA